MIKIIGMSREDLFDLEVPSSAYHTYRFLSEEEIIYIAVILGSFWRYDYEAAGRGRFGFHAELKSLRHSDGFFGSRILFQYPNIRMLIAKQLKFRFRELNISKPVWVAGIPDGATELGQDVASAIGAQNADIRKENGRIIFQGKIRPGETLLLIEDFCTRGTGFIEAVREIMSKQPEANILPYELVVINRGGLREIIMENGKFNIISVVNYRIRDWDPEECPLCKMGSVPIKPKATDENWRLITTSQSKSAEG